MRNKPKRERTIDRNVGIVRCDCGWVVLGTTALFLRFLRDLIGHFWQTPAS